LIILLILCRIGYTDDVIRILATEAKQFATNFIIRPHIRNVDFFKFGFLVLIQILVKYIYIQSLHYCILFARIKFVFFMMTC
jgi:hypothetical protein